MKLCFPAKLSSLFNIQVPYTTSTKEAKLLLVLEVLNLNHFKLITICSENRHKSPYFPDFLSVLHCRSRGDEKRSGFISVCMQACLIYISSGIAFHY